MSGQLAMANLMAGQMPTLAHPWLRLWAEAITVD